MYTDNTCCNAGFYNSAISCHCIQLFGVMQEVRLGMRFVYETLCTNHIAETIYHMIRPSFSVPCTILFQREKDSHP